MKKRTIYRAVSILTAAVILHAGFAPAAQAKYRDNSDELPGFVSTSTLLIIGAVAAAGGIVLLATSKGGDKNEPADVKGDTDSTSTQSTAAISLRRYSAPSSPKAAESQSGLGVFMGLSTADARSIQPSRGLKPSNIEVKMGVSLGF